MNYYETLGVVPDSPAGEIRQAYLAAARAFHPDFHVNADTATRQANAELMQQLNEAWEVVGDPTSRQAYDRSLHLNLDPGVARRAARETNLPPGKGWTPRADDDGWMTDYQAWADESDVPLDDAPRSAGRKLVTVLPLSLFGLAVLLIFIGLALGTDVLVAAGFMCIVASAGLFFLLPMFEMSRGARR